MNYYMIGDFAKKVGVTKKAIMYYQQEGLLSPALGKENGYRYFTDDDIIKIQKILVMRYLGMSIKDIKVMFFEEDSQELAESLKIQTELINSKILNLQNINKNIKMISELLENGNTVKWPEIIRLVKLLNMGDNLVRHYKDAANINARIQLHKIYSTAKKDWYRFLFDFYQFGADAAVLELGCGNGELWDTNKDRLNADFTLILSDVSSGMLNDAKLKLDPLVKAQYQIIDCCDIPFRDHSLDVVIANHVMFYAKNVEKAVAEISRVLKPDGCFYCTTYGRQHMKAIEEIAKNFDSRISLSDINLYELFGLENGTSLLEKHFDSVTAVIHDDRLEITDISPLYKYIMSCHGNQAEIILEKKDKFQKYLKAIMRRQKVIMVDKQAGIFICRK